MSTISRGTLEHYFMDAKAGNVDAQFYLARCYHKGEGIDEIKKDEEEAVKWYSIAAESEHADAQYWLGVCYSLGEGIENSREKAIEWWRKAAEKGHSRAQYTLGKSLFYSGKTMEAKKWLNKAEKNGDSEAKDFLRKFEKDLDEIDLYTAEIDQLIEAAEEGDARAQYVLGFQYAAGVNVDRDESKEIEWIGKAAEQGNVDAQVSLGMCYQYGSGVGIDVKKAVEWYRKAAEKGSQIAKDHLKEIG